MQETQPSGFSFPMFRALKLLNYRNPCHVRATPSDAPRRTAVGVSPRPPRELSHQRCILVASREARPTARLDRSQARATPQRRRRRSTAAQGADRAGPASNLDAQEPFPCPSLT
jgi:hypothetical protein